MLQNRSVPDVRAKREAWKKHIPENDVNNPVFLDESGVNTNMTGRYTRSKTNERTVDSAPVNTPCSTTILSSICLDGKTTHTVYQGGTTVERFAEYLENILLPTLSGNDIIIMDNNVLPSCENGQRDSGLIRNQISLSSALQPGPKPD